MFCTDYDPSLETEFVNLALQHKVDGIIGLTYNTNLVVPDEVSFVSIDRIINTHTPCVSSDNFAGGQLAAEKLHALGCKKVLFIRMWSAINGETYKRLSGFEYGCRSYNLPCESHTLIDTHVINETKAVLAKYLEPLFKGQCAYDGIFCGTDLLALLVRDILVSFGLSVPGDVEIIGFDGIKDFATEEYVCSTIVQPVEDIAEAAVDLLLRDNLDTTPPLLCLPVTFGEGKTTSS